MRIYVERPVVAIRQVAGDLLVVVWAYLWIRLGFWLHGLLEKLAVPGQQLENLGNNLADNLGGASKALDGVPLVGNGITAPLDKAADGARAVADAARQQQVFVHDLALVLPIGLSIVPLALILFVWLPLRVRGIRRRATLAALRGSTAGRDLLALRALAGQPLAKLSKIHPDAASAWRRGDESAVDALAALELRHSGLKAQWIRHADLAEQA
jgi:hypothetical protein